MTMFTTIHHLATHFTDEMVDARPTKGMLDAFRRAGRRDGRRNVSWEPAHQYLQEAIQLAAMKHVHDLRTQLDTVADASRRLNQDLGRTERSLAGHGRRMTAIPAPTSNGTDPSPTPDGDQASPLALLHRARSARQADTMGSQFATERDRRDDIHGQLATHDDQVQDLHRDCRERISATVEVGQLLWTRYCAGYVQRATDDRHPPALLAITVDSSVPPDLRWVDADAAAGAPEPG